LPKPLREAAIEHAKEITQQDMSNSLDQVKKGKKKKKIVSVSSANTMLSSPQKTNNS
jgi:hypothetical protein